MEIEPPENVENLFESSSLIRNIVMGGLAAAATVAARAGAERSWSAIYKKPPPNKRATEDDADLKDAVVWAVVVGAATGLIRLGVRRTLRKKVKSL